MQFYKWLGLSSSLLAVFTAGERYAVAAQNWAPKCKLQVDLCDPVQTPWLAESRGSTSTSMAASPNTVYFGNSIHVSSTSAVTSLNDGQVLKTPWATVIIRSKYLGR